jgi:hypothetical protein
LQIWISSFHFNNKVHRFLVNGQTGKVSGNAPISAMKITIISLVAIVIIAIFIIFFGGQ